LVAKSQISTSENCEELGVCSQLSALEGVEGHDEALGWD